MESIIRDFSKIKEDVEEKEYFLRHDCGMCDALVNNRELGAAVVERLLKAYQLEKRNVKGPDSEFSKRRKDLLSEIKSLYENNGINEYDPCMSKDIKNYRQAKKYYKELSALDEEMETAKWISEHGENFAWQLEEYRNGKFKYDVQKLLKCSEAYQKALDKKIGEKINGINKEEESVLHKAGIMSVTKSYMCENNLSAVNDCIEKTGETKELIKERSNRRIYFYQAEEDIQQSRMNEIDVIIENLRKEKNVCGMKMAMNELMEEMERVSIMLFEKEGTNERD